MNLRIRRTSKRTATIAPRKRRQNTGKPIPYAIVPRSSDLLSIQDTLATIAQEVLPTAGHADGKYFAPVDVIPMAIPKQDVMVISAALLSIGTWENDPKVMSLFHRLPTMRSRIMGALQDRLPGHE